MKRIPKKWNFGHWHIVVRQVPRALLSDICADSDGAWVATFAIENSEAGVIYLESEMPLEEKWNILYHELVHAAHDIGYYHQRFGAPDDKRWKEKYDA
jgi:hypothetical protein